MSGQSGCPAEAGVPRADAGARDPGHQRIGFCIYSRDSGKRGVIEGVEVKRYMTRSVWGGGGIHRI